MSQILSTRENGTRLEKLAIKSHLAMMLTWDLRENINSQTSLPQKVVVTKNGFFYAVVSTLVKEQNISENMSRGVTL